MVYYRLIRLSIQSALFLKSTLRKHLQRGGAFSRYDLEEFYFVACAVSADDKCNVENDSLRFLSQWIRNEIQSTVGKKMADVHFTTMPCEPNMAYKAQIKPFFFSLIVSVLRASSSLGLKIL